MRISARNQPRADVTKVAPGASISNVELDVGAQRVVTSVTLEAVDELEITEAPASSPSRARASGHRCLRKEGKHHVRSLEKRTQDDLSTLVRPGWLTAGRLACLSR